MGAIAVGPTDSTFPLVGSIAESRSPRSPRSLSNLAAPNASPHSARPAPPPRRALHPASPSNRAAFADPREHPRGDSPLQRCAIESVVGDALPDQRRWTQRDFFSQDPFVAPSNIWSSRPWRPAFPDPFAGGDTLGPQHQASGGVPHLTSRCLPRVAARKRARGSGLLPPCTTLRGEAGRRRHLVLPACRRLNRCGRWRLDTVKWWVVVDIAAAAWRALLMERSRRLAMQPTWRDPAWARLASRQKCRHQKHPSAITSTLRRRCMGR